MRLLLATIRAGVEAGLTDEQIIEGLAAREEQEAMYGEPDADHFGGPAHLRDDAYYARNDAGEYSWM